MTKTALITGASGFLGRQVYQAFERAGYNVVGIAYSRANPPSLLKVDLGNQTAVESLVAESKPDVVVHCAANRFPDKCDRDPGGARRINVEATRHLVQSTVKRKALLIYISTDYVFPGKPGEAPYEAEAEPQPTNVYGTLKLEGEKEVLVATKGTGLGVILRVPVLYGPAEENKESAVNVLMDAVEKAQDQNVGIKMDAWAQRYPTNTEDVARVCLDVASKYLDAGDQKRSLPATLQFSSEDRFTKWDIAELFAEIMGLPLDGMTADTTGADPKAGVQRPYDTHLSTKALRDMGVPVHTQDFKAWWRWQVKAYRK